MQITKQCFTCEVEHTPEHTALKRNKNFFCSKECYWKSIRGVKLSKEHAQKISDGQRGRVSPMKGKHFNHKDATKRKISIANKGKIRARGKYANNWRGGVTSQKDICLKCGLEYIGIVNRKFCSKKCALQSSQRTESIIKTGKINGNIYTDPIDRIIATKFSDYRNGANKRNKSFDISKEQFSVLTKKDCTYCGDECAMGVDRLDSKIGYTVENSVPCCKRCNYAKHIMDLDEFKVHIAKIFNHLI